MSDGTLKNILFVGGIVAGAALVVAIYNRQKLKEKYFPQPEVVRVPVQRGLPQPKKKK